MKAKTGRFSLETDAIYQGYTYGQTWNGHACPLFEIETAKEIAKAASYAEEGFLISYSPEKNAFILDYQGEVEEVNAQEIETEEGPRTVYPLGSHSWTWWDEEWN